MIQAQNKRRLFLLVCCVVWLCACSETNDTTSPATHTDTHETPDTAPDIAETFADDTNENPYIPTTSAVAPITSSALFIVNGGSETLTVINTDAGSRVADIPFYYAHFPHHISLSIDGRAFWVAVPSIDLSQGFNLAQHGDGSPPQPAVLKLDAFTGETLATRILDTPNYNAIQAPDGSVWTSATTDPGAVLILDPNTLETAASIPVGLGPAEITFTPNGLLAFVANTADDTVSVIDVLSRQVIKTLAVGQTPTAAWPSPDNTLAFVTNEASKTLSVIDIAALEVTRTYALNFTPAFAAIAPNKELWITNPAAGRVERYSATDDTHIGSIPTGFGAYGITFPNPPTAAYVTNQDEDTLSILDLTTLTVTKTLIVGHQPNGLAWRPAP